MKYAVSIVVIILIIGGGIFYFSKQKTKAAENESKPQTHTVARENLVQKVASNGTISPNLVVDIKCKASGEIITLPFDISDEVHQGELLVELDPSDEERSVDISTASLAQAQANLAKARQNLKTTEDDIARAIKSAEVDLSIAIINAEEARAKANRQKELYEQGFVGEEVYQAAITAAETAEANIERAKLALQQANQRSSEIELRRQDVRVSESSLESAQINLSLAKQRLDDTRVYSPIDGVVTSRLVQIGQIISSGISNTGGGTTIMSISDLSKLYVLASVDESDIGRVEKGQRAEITADAFPNMKFDGIVERIAPKGTTVSNVVTFEVKIEITSENKFLLKPEMTANIEIIIQKAENTIAVPSGAVFRVEGKPFVKVQKPDGTTEERAVETGINTGDMTEIKSGLAEGEIVVIERSAQSSEWRRNGGGSRPPMGMFGGGGMRR